ncbi:unnamed protein product [Calicophoron daubneyi]|uniref:Annexin n=1 Tax=Calicophoron daubneyi TaxID=300641 RepID=A0AAV2TLF4_CALDB
MTVRSKEQLILSSFFRFLAATNGLPNMDSLWVGFDSDEFKPTLHAYEDFDVDEDCKTLKTAMRGMGTDEKAIIDVMGHRTVYQRLQIVDRFKTLYGKDLKSELKSELSGHFKDTMLALCLSPVDYDATELRKAMKGAGTNENALIEILCSRTNAQIEQIKDAYSTLFPGRNLEEDIVSDTSGPFRRVMVSLLQGQRDDSTSVDDREAFKDARALFDAGEGQLGTDESVFNEILATKSPCHIRAVIKEYSKISSKTLEEALKSEMSGPTLRSFLAIIRCIQNKPKYFALQLKKSMEGLGTKDRDLVRIVVSRCEIDMGYIKDEFLEMTGKPLADWISDDTSGDYKRILLALIGDDSE